MIDVSVVTYNFDFLIHYPFIFFYPLKKSGKEWQLSDFLFVETIPGAFDFMLEISANVGKTWMLAHMPLHFFLKYENYKRD